MLVLRLFPIFVLVLFILFQKSSIRIVKSDLLTVKLNFNILALVFKDDDGKKIRPTRLIKSLRKYNGALKSVRYLISKSDFVIYDSESLTNLLIFLYLDANAKSVGFVDHAQNEISRDEIPSKIDITVYFSLIYLIISALIFLYYTVKNKIKRVLKNV